MSAAQKSTNVRINRAPWPIRAAIRFGSAVAPEATARRALDLFTTPMRSSRVRALGASTQDAVERRLTIGAMRIATYTWGDIDRRPRVLLSHGWSSYGLRFVPWVAPLLDRGCSVVAFDQPGHGRNEAAKITLPGFAETVRSVVEHFGEFDTAVGHSLGGAAVAAAMAHGAAIARAVLIAPAADGVAAMRRFANAIDLPEHRRQDVQRQLELATGMKMDEFASHQLAPRLAAPALIVHDLMDTDVPWEEGERYARFWPGARLVNVQGLGHHRIVNDSEVMSLAMRFLAGEQVGERVVSTQALVFAG